MSSPLTLFQPAHQQPARSLGGVYNALEASRVDSFPFDNVLTSTSFSSGLCTPFDQALLSPLDIPLLTTNTHRASIGPIGTETGAYNQLMQQYHIMWNKFHREKQEHALLKMWHSELMHSHNTLTNMYAKATKRPCTEDHVPDLVTHASVTPHDHCKEEEPQPTTVPVYSRSDFPDIKYWTREEFTEFEAMKKNSTDPTSKSGGWGKMRCANDENVNSTYLERSDGTSLSGKKAGAIQAYTRSIWVDLYARGLAPKKWSNASRRVHDKKTRKDNEKETKGPAPKKLKTMTEDDYMGVSQTDTLPKDSDDNNNNNNNDNNNNNNNNDSPAPSWLKNNMQEGLLKGASKLRPRPLTDPLANAFDQCNPAFHLLGDIPCADPSASTINNSLNTNNSIGSHRNTTSADPIPLVAPGTVTHTQDPEVPTSFVKVTGPGVPPSYVSGPGVPPPSYPSPVTHIQGPSAPPIATPISMPSVTDYLLILHNLHFLFAT